MVERPETMKALLNAGNTVATAMVNRLDVMLRSEDDPDLSDIERLLELRDRLDGWARDVRAAASEWKP